MTLIKTVLVVLALLPCAPALAGDHSIIRIGSMAGGTLAWELAIIKQEGLLAEAGVTVETITTANQQAGKIALQSGNVDMVLSDWIWASTMLDSGVDYRFFPYSTATGGVMVANDSPIRSITDLQGKRIGVAGGELDKNWLLLQALAKQQNLELAKAATPVYGAPPLLNEQLASGRLDALLTYWHFGARLEAKGFRQLLGGGELLQQLGIEAELPTLGYVFSQQWANQHKTALSQFLAATQTAKNRICGADAAWSKVAAMTETEDPAIRQQLRQRYCAGRVAQWGEKERSAAKTLFALLHGLGGSKLTGKSARLNEDVFWHAE